MADKKVAYLCDGLVPECSEKIGCYRCLDPNMRTCTHTRDEKHAIFGMCEKPEENPVRFEEIDNSDFISFWEIEPNCKFWETGIM